MRRLLFILLSIFVASNALSQPSFFLVGDGDIDLKNLKTGASVKIRYRKGDNQYDEAALKKINRVYGSSYDDPVNRMSLRFLEILAYLQDHFQGAQIQILSGFRSLGVNQGLRNQGRLAAQSSMHTEAAAADIKLAGVEITTVKDYAMELSCCGVGYYHGKHIHLDTGPKRWWDEKTSGTEKKEPQENEKIILLTKKDIYSPRDSIDFDFVRVTAYPIGVSNQVGIEKFEKDQWKKIDDLIVSCKGASCAATECRTLSERPQIKNLLLENKKSLPTGRYRISVAFCEKKWAKMPESTSSNEFEIR